jgi:hypothetical protein
MSVYIEQNLFRLVFLIAQLMLALPRPGNEFQCFRRASVFPFDADLVEAITDGINQLLHSFHFSFSQFCQLPHIRYESPKIIDTLIAQIVTQVFGVRSERICILGSSAVDVQSLIINCTQPLYPFDDCG